MIRVLAAICLLNLAACGDAGVADDPPPPPGAQPLQANGAWETPYDLAVSRLRRRLEPVMGAVVITDYQMPLDASWATVVAYYDGRLAGLQPNQALAGPQRGYDLHVWEGRGGRRVAVAWFDRPAGEGPQILAVATSR